MSQERGSNGIPPKAEDTVPRSETGIMASTIRRSPTPEELADFFAAGWQSLEKGEDTQAAIGLEIRNNFTLLPQCLRIRYNVVHG